MFNCCVFSMIFDDNNSQQVNPDDSAMNVFSIDENKILDANGITFAEAITCYKCTFCGKMFAAMEVVLNHYQSFHRSSVIPLLKRFPPTSHPFASISRSPSPIASKYFSSTLSENTEPPKSRSPSPMTQDSDHSNDISIDIHIANDICNNNVEAVLETNDEKAQADLVEEDDLEVQEITPEEIINKKDEIGNEPRAEWVPQNKANKRRFVCKFRGCNRTFAYEASFLSHKRLHHVKSKPQLYTCDWDNCEFKCTDKSGLRFHKLSHAGDKPFKCSWPLCDQSFSDVKAQDEHFNREHIADKTLACDWPNCNLTFTDSVARSLHRFEHTGQKPSLNIEDFMRRAPGLAPPRKRGRPPKSLPSVTVNEVEMACGFKTKIENGQVRLSKLETPTPKKLGRPSTKNGSKVQIGMNKSPKRAKKIVDSILSMIDDVICVSDNDLSEKKEANGVVPEKKETDNKDLKDEEIGKGKDIKQSGKKAKKNKEEEKTKKKKITKAEVLIKAKKKNIDKIINKIKNKSSKVQTANKGTEKAAKVEKEKKELPEKKEKKSKVDKKKNSMLKCSYFRCKQSFATAEERLKHETEKHQSATTPPPTRWKRKCKPVAFYTFS